MTEKINIQRMIKNQLKHYSCYLAKFQEKINEITSEFQSRLSQAKSIIGLDIGTTSVKLAQLANVEGEWALTRTALVDIEFKEEKDKEQATLVALKKALVGINTKKAVVICVINCPKTCVRRLIVPHMPRQEMLEAMRWEARNYIPFSLDEAILDFSILGEVVDKNVKKLSIAVAATPKETVNKLLALFAPLRLEPLKRFTQSEIKVSAIIPVSVALQNLIAKSNLEQDETIAIVELGASLTELNIYKNSRLEFSRKFPVAGADITKSMTGALVSEQGRVELTIEEAEKIKKQWGLPPPDKLEMIEGKISTTQILSLIRPMVEQLTNEIERSFDFYQEESRAGKVNKIILFGGSAQLKRLVEFLSDELGVEVKVGNSLEDIKVLPEAVRPGHTISHRLDLAIGATLTGAGFFDLTKDKGINLLPVELKEETKQFVKKVSLKAVATFVITLSLLFYIGMRIQFKAYEKKLKAAKVEYNSLVSQFKELREKILISQALLNRPYWEDVLKEISNIVPSNVYLTSLSMKNNAVNLKGIIAPSSQTAEATISNFMLTLEEGIFKNVSLVTTKKRVEDPTTSTFEIKCEID